MHKRTLGDIDGSFLPGAFFVRKQQGQVYRDESIRDLA